MLVYLSFSGWQFLSEAVSINFAGEQLALGAAKTSSSTLFHMFCLSMFQIQTNNITFFCVYLNSSLFSLLFIDYCLFVCLNEFNFSQHYKAIQTIGPDQLTDSGSQCQVFLGVPPIQVLKNRGPCAMTSMNKPLIYIWSPPRTSRQLLNFFMVFWILCENKHCSYNNAKIWSRNRSINLTCNIS